MARVLELIWVRWEQVFFGKSERKDSTRLSTNRPTGKSLDCGENTLLISRMRCGTQRIAATSAGPDCQNWADRRTNRHGSEPEYRAHPVRPRLVAGAAVAGAEVWSRDISARSRCRRFGRAAARGAAGVQKRGRYRHGGRSD